MQERSIDAAGASQDHSLCTWLSAGNVITSTSHKLPHPCDVQGRVHRSAAGRSLHSVIERRTRPRRRAHRGGGAAEDLLGWAVMQMVERPWGITAFGSASVKAVPDLVRVRFKIVRVEQAPAAAFEAARSAG